MPTYEYRCRACGHEFERFQKISDSPVRTCPSCKKRRVERLISAGGGLVFKGPGFYATDYAKSGGPESPSKTKEGGEGSAGEAKEGGDSKKGTDGKAGDSGDKKESSA